MFTQYKIIKLTGVKENKHVDISEFIKHFFEYSEISLSNYDFLKLDYTFKGKEYSVYSDGLITTDNMPSEVSKDTWIINATLYEEDKSIDVTRAIIAIAGPQIDFHDRELDFSWVFPEHRDAFLKIIFHDGSVSIDINTNKVTKGQNKHIPLVSYDDPSTSDIEEATTGTDVDDFEHIESEDSD
jgi:hypothetical protein